MKITREKMVKAINEEVKKYIKEMKGPFAKQMKQAAQSDAYRDHMSTDDNSGAATAAAEKEKAFQAAHKSQLASKEGMPDWMLEEEDEDLYSPSTSSELQSEKIFDLMWAPLLSYIKSNAPQAAYQIEIEVEDKLLDIAMAVRDIVKSNPKASRSRFAENKKRK